MSNQAFSEAEDLMVGAGELYFKRDDDNNKSFHHLGNVEEFNINTDITTVEKNSSMNKRRELMASVVTAVNPTASLTMNEYDPYNAALGLFGVENVHKQEAAELTDEEYVVTSTPGILSIVDADGNKYYNLKDIVLRPASATPSTYTFASGTDGAGIFTDPGTGASVGGGGTLQIVGTYTASTDADIYMKITSPNTTVGDLAGLVIEYRTGLVGSWTTVHVTTGTTYSFVIGTTGLTCKVDVARSAPSSGVDFTASESMQVINCKAGSSTYTPGKDYVVEEQSSRAGLVKIKAGGKIKAGDTVKVSAKVEEANYVTVAGAQAGEIHGELLFIGDANQGDNYVLEGWSVKITPDGDFTGLISDDFGSFTLNVKFLADYENNPDYPYYKLTKVGSANFEAGKGIYDPKE